MINLNLENKVALVTGSGEGIGRGCALVLAQAGAEVIVNDINPMVGEKTAEDVRKLGRRSLFVEADVSDAMGVKAMFAAVKQEFSAVHILVNNAGFNLFKGIQDTSIDEWERIFAVDVRGLYLMTQTFLPLLKAAGSASVINIASVHAQATVANITAYAAAKGAVVAMGRSLCQELGPLGIRVNTISPGFVMTPLLERWLNSEPDREATMARVNGYHPIKRIGAPEDIGYLVAFLGSDLSSNITGQNITSDGGLTTRLMH